MNFDVKFKKKCSRVIEGTSRGLETNFQGLVLSNDILWPNFHDMLGPKAPKGGPSKKWKKKHLLIVSYLSF